MKKDSRKMKAFKYIAEWLTGGIALAGVWLLIRWLFLKNADEETIELLMLMYIAGGVILWQTISRRIHKRTPEEIEVERLTKIEENDERNIAIRGKAAHKTFYAGFIFVFLLLTVLLAANLQPPLYITLGSVGVFNLLYYIGAYLYYAKKM